jgi:hypothetical protein
VNKQAVYDAQALLAAWRERGVDRLDPVRYHFIEALARRASTHSGEAGRLLDDKLSALLQSCQADIEGDAHGSNAGDNAAKATSAGPGPLAGLTAYIASQAPTDGVRLDVDDTADGGGSSPELPAIDYFRNIWARVGAKQLLRQSQAKVPENAGPLNSTNLVHRSLALMRDLSPQYLQYFMSYVDALSWMEQLSEGGIPTGKEGPSAQAAKRATRNRQR